MIKLFYLLIVVSLFIYYLYRIIKKKNNPTLNGAATVVFGLASFREIIPVLSKFIGKFLE